MGGRGCRALATFLRSWPSLTPSSGDATAGRAGNSSRASEQQQQEGVGERGRVTRSDNTTVEPFIGNNSSLEFTVPKEVFTYI